MTDDLYTRHPFMQSALLVVGVRSMDGVDIAHMHYTHTLSLLRKDCTGLAPNRHLETSGHGIHAHPLPCFSAHTGAPAGTVYTKSRLEPQLMDASADSG